MSDSEVSVSVEIKLRVVVKRESRSILTQGCRRIRRFMPVEKVLIIVYSVKSLS